MDRPTIASTSSASSTSTSTASASASTSASQSTSPSRPSTRSASMAAAASQQQQTASAGGDVSGGVVVVVASNDNQQPDMFNDSTDSANTSSTSNRTIAESPPTSSSSSSNAIANASVAADVVAIPAPPTPTSSSSSSRPTVTHERIPPVEYSAQHAARHNSPHVQLIRIDGDYLPNNSTESRRSRRHLQAQLRNLVGVMGQPQDVPPQPQSSQEQQQQQQQLQQQQQPLPEQPQPAAMVEPPRADVVAAVDEQPQQPQAANQANQANDAGAGELEAFLRAAIADAPIIILDSQSTPPPPPPSTPPVVAAAPTSTTTTSASSSTRKRRRINSQTPTPPKRQSAGDGQLPTEDDDDGSTCPICLDSWEMSGEHRLTSLKCGHLFGESCIRRWFSGVAANARCCPSCKSKSNLRDIRSIYAKRVSVVDKSEEYRLQRLLDDEIGKVNSLRQEIALMKLELDLQRKFNTKLESQLEETRLTAINLNASLMSASQQSQIQMNMSASSASSASSTANSSLQPQQQQQQYQPQASGSTGGVVSTSVPPPTAMRRYKFSCESTINISAESGCRVLINGRRSDNLIVSQKSTQQLFPGFGVRFVDLATFRLTSFLHMASKQIRDLTLDQNEQFLAAASMDRTCKVYNVHNRGCLTSLTPCDAPIWSVRFDRARERTIYLGTQTGSTFAYDVRQTAAAAEEYRTVGDASPVISIASVTPLQPDFPFGGFLVCKLQSLWFFEYTGGQQVTATRLPLPGPFVGMSYADETQSLLCSTRPTSTQPVSQLIFAELRKVEQTTTLQVITQMAGSRTQAVMTRSAQVRVENTTMVASYMQDVKVLQTWQVRKERLENVRQQAVPIDDCVLDLCPIYGIGAGMAQLNPRRQLQQRQVFVAALTDTRCRIFRVHGEGEM